MPGTEIVVDKPQKKVIRASSTPRFVLCPGSEFMQQVSSTSEPARLGTAAHVCAANIVAGVDPQVTVAAQLYDVDEDELKSLVWSMIDMWEENSVFFPYPKTEIELGPLDLALDVETIGHADIVSWPGDGTIRVGDWKTGWKTDADYMAQLKTYALLAWYRWKADRGPFADEDIHTVSVSVLWVRERALDTKVFALEVLVAWEKILRDAAASRQLVLGAHCRHCRAYECPAIRASLQQFRPGNEIEEINGENVIAAYHLANAVKSRYEQVIGACEQYVQGAGAIDAGDGMILAMKPTTRTAIKGTSKALEIIEKRLTREELAPALTISKSTLLDAVTAKVPSVPRGGKKLAKEELLSELTEVGAIKESTSWGLGLIKGTAPALPSAGGEQLAI